MTEVTFIVPAAPDHEVLLERALASIAAQTIACEEVVVYDTARRGAGWARNQGIAQVRTPFLAFLDADDEVLPAFAERTLAHYQPHRFVFTDWYDFDRRTKAPDCPFLNGNRSVITTLIATEDVRRVGGFDEALGGMEDTHLYLKLMASGVCGLYVPEPLFRYHPDGARSKAFYQTPAYHAAVQRFNREFGSKPMAECGGCGGSPYANPEIQNLPIGDPQAGDVKAQALWAGNRQERGRITGRLYPRASNGKQLWMSPQDIDAAPHLFSRVVEMPTPVGDDTVGWKRLTGQLSEMLGAGKAPPVQTPAPAYAQRGEVAPDVAQVQRLFQQHT